MLLMDSKYLTTFPTKKVAENITSQRDLYQKYYKFFYNHKQYYQKLLDNDTYLRNWGTAGDKLIIISEHEKVHQCILDLHQFYKSWLDRLEGLKKCTKQTLVEETFLFCFQELWKGKYILFIIFSL